jgi:predicted acylesterase/phospholipase RssA
MTGGGAKGLYEAGVIHAFHIAGMEFDVITGSSIGAFNAIFYAEYLLRKKTLSTDILADPLKTVEAMDSMVKAFHHAWLTLPDQQIIDDSEDGPLGRLKEDLLQFNLRLPDLTRLVWWWTDPTKGRLPSPAVGRSGLKLLAEMLERIGGLDVMFSLFKEHREHLLEKSIRTYLARFNLEKSMVPGQDDQKLSSVFTTPIEPLQPYHLQSDGRPPHGEGQEPVALVPAGRTLRDFCEAGIDVRLTRANYRTGRLEVSTYISLHEFLGYLMKQAWRLRRPDPEKIPLGSFRIHIPGNPVAINAALASGRFPGVLEPYPVEKIYPSDVDDNQLLDKMLDSWLDDPQVEAQLTAAYQDLYPEDYEAASRFKKTYASWRDSRSMRSFFPQRHDLYVDGGAIDNTPSNSAIDSTRDWISAMKKSIRDVSLDLYTVFLHPEPVVKQTSIENQALHQVILRTLEIQGAAKQSSDAVVVDTVNTFGRRAEDLGYALAIVLQHFRSQVDALEDGQKTAIAEAIREAAKETGLSGFLGQDPEGILDRMQDWANGIIDQKLPLHVNKVVIYPDEMPMDTLQFTERLGYRTENALQMLTMGCYHGLETILGHLVGSREPLEDQDVQALALTKRWMGLEETPEGDDALGAALRTWKCQRVACVFHAGICSKGAPQPLA